MRMVKISGIFHFSVANEKDALAKATTKKQLATEWINRKKVLIFAATTFFGMDIIKKGFLDECNSTKVRDLL